MGRFVGRGCWVVVGLLSATGGAGGWACTACFSRGFHEEGRRCQVRKGKSASVFGRLDRASIRTLGGVGPDAVLYDVRSERCCLLGSGLAGHPRERSHHELGLSRCFGCFRGPHRTLRFLLARCFVRTPALSSGAVAASVVRAAATAWSWRWPYRRPGLFHKKDRSRYRVSTAYAAAPTAYALPPPPPCASRSCRRAPPTSAPNA